MRYDRTAKFTEECKKYDTSLGKEVSKVMNSKDARVNLTDASENVMNVAFGEIRQGSQIARIQGRLSFKPTHVQFDGIRYKVAMRRVLRCKTTFVVEEVTDK